MTLLCVPIMVDEPASALADAREARDKGADLVEFRVDGFFTGAHDLIDEQATAIIDIVSRSPLACIVTCRPVLEGGQYDGPDDARIALYERLGTAGSANAPAGSDKTYPPRYIDVEAATYTRSENIKQKVNLAVDHASQLREVTTSLILSSHDFHTRPPDLIRRLEQMFNEPAARVVKVAYRARSLRDNLELLDILAEVRSGQGSGGKPMIALAMGPFGLMSRVLAPKFDAFLTFASLRRNSATAPGQPIISELVDLFRFRSIDSATKVYGVIGYPVEHSLSPLVHNAGFEAMGHNGVYLPLPIPPEYEHFKATLPALIEHVHLDFHGCSVTMPHKEHLVRLAQELQAEGDNRWVVDPLCQRCGAANTLTIERDGRGNALRLRVSNTDASAVASLLGERLPPGRRRVCILGVGGTSRAVISRLLDDSAEILLINRTREKAEALAAELAPTGGGPSRISVIEDHELAGLTPEAILNCTPVGMRLGPNPEQSPLDSAILRNLPASTLVADCVYNPLRTPLLAAAEAAGLSTLDGAAMFVRQAAEQFTTWTHQQAPIRLFDRIVRETLQTPAPPLPPLPPAAEH